jgi:hypothetical protein
MVIEFDEVTPARRRGRQRGEGPASIGPGVGCPDELLRRVARRVTEDWDSMFEEGAG